MKNENNNSVSDRIIQDFQNISYNMLEPILVPCFKHGIPQNRKRVIFIGYRDKTENIDEFITKFKNINISYNPLNNIIENSLENSIMVENLESYGCNLWKDVDNILSLQGKPATNLLKCIEQNKLSWGKRNSSTHSEIVNLNGYSKTIQCTYGRMPRLFVPLKCNDKYYLREFTINELKQIQGFPKDYKLYGNKLSQITQIGNAVPPIIVKHIIENLINI